MLIDPLVDQRRSLPAADYAVVLIIPAVTAAFGFLWGVAVGLLAAALFFIVTFARIDLVRLETTAARMRSRVERPEAEQAWLARAGREALDLRPRRLRLLRHRAPAGQPDRGGARPRAPRPRFVLIDFQRVRGIDISAARALARLDETCRAGGGRAWSLTGLDPAAARLIRGQAAGPAPRLVAAARGGARGGRGRAARRGPGRRRRSPASSTSCSAATRPPTSPATSGRCRSRPGAEVIAQGGPSDFLLVLPPACCAPR